uniref:Putative N-acetylneuraminate synthase n=1 Tax=viral metagenome TaxID=1070528 RepID=A0A6H1ZX86_9ZZZZ
MTLLVAEIGINHNGDMTIAKKLIAMAASMGCDYVKFQKRNIDLVYTKDELDQPRKSPWGDTNREQKMGLELSWDQYADLWQYCQYVGIKMFWSVWDEATIETTATGFPWRPELIKVPSALITDKKILNAVRATGIPAVISTGMSDAYQVERAIDFLLPAWVLACTSTYPCPVGDVNLGEVVWLKQVCKSYPGMGIGFSNHSPGLVFIPAAIALGAAMVEFHITLDRSMYGSDQAASIEPEGVHRLVKWTRSLEEGMGHQEKRIQASELPVREKLRFNLPREELDL